MLEEKSAILDNFFQFLDENSNTGRPKNDVFVVKNLFAVAALCGSHPVSREMLHHHLGIGSSTHARISKRIREEDDEGDLLHSAADKKRRSNVFDDYKVKEVTDFWLESSVPSPMKGDTVTNFKKDGGNREQEQRRVLQETMTETWKNYCESHGPIS